LSRRPLIGGCLVGLSISWNIANVGPVAAIVCGAPLVGLSFGLPGNGRIGFAVLAALWLSAVALLPQLRLESVDHG
jgi:hypothetical protein